MKFSLETLSNFKQILKELSIGLTRLDFVNNFQSFQTEVTITANTEEKIRNELTFIPTKMLIVKQTGNALVTAGDTVWTANYLYLKNHDAANDATVKVIFFK